MKKINRNKFVKGRVEDFRKSEGWFIGQFMEKWGFPELETNEVEICWKVLRKNEKDSLHYHKKGVEIAIVISGWFNAVVEGEEVEVKEKEFLVVYPEAKLERFVCRERTEVVVIKSPSVPSDKYEVKN